MTQDSTGRPDDDPTAKVEQGSAPNTDPGPYGPTAYGQQYQYPQPGYQPDGYPPPGYPQPPLGAYGAYPGYPPPARGTNTMAILALVFAFVFAPAGIVFGIIARNQIARTGEEGEGLALAGLIVGAVFTLLIVAYIIFMVAIFAAAFSAIPAQT